METFVAFDNGGKTPDRFTIVDIVTGEIYGADESGNVRTCGNCAKGYYTMYGAGWRQRRPHKRIIKREVDNFINNAKFNREWIGEGINFPSLPQPVQQAICQLALREQPEKV
jgi:hypothetical protein